MTTDGRPDDRRARRLRSLLLIGCLVVAAACIAALVWRTATTTPSSQGPLERVVAAVGGSNEIQEHREQVMDRARQFMLRVNTYGPDDLAQDGTMPDYREGVTELITPKFEADFEQNVTLAEQTVSQAGLGRTAAVHGVGVASLGQDRATVLVAGSFRNSYPAPGGGKDGDKGGDKADGKDGDRIEDRPAPFRVEVELVRTGGEWLVDAFAPVTGEDEQ